MLLKGSFIKSVLPFLDEKCDWVKEFKVGHPAIFLPIQANFQTFLTAKLSIKKIKNKPLNAQCWQSVNAKWGYEKEFVIILPLKVASVLE